MGKLKCNIYAPIEEYSYYGDSSRLFTRHLIETRSDLDIHIVEYRRSDAANGYSDNLLKQYCIGEFMDPDVCFYFCHPTLYNKFGTKANIGFIDTTTILSNNDIKLFVNKCNLLSAIFVSSNYAKNTLQNLKYINNGVEVKINVPIAIIPEFSDIQGITFNSGLSPINSIPSPYNFLLIGRWDTEDQSGFGGKNKDNIHYIVSNFLNTFKDIDNAPGLIVNVYGDIPGTVDERNLGKALNDIKKSISFNKSLPNIYLLNGILSPHQTAALYNDRKIIALIHTPQRTDSVKSELNFMSTGKPIIYSGFGTQTEILNRDGNVSVNCDVKELNSDVRGAGPKLADVYGDCIKYALYEVYCHYESLRKSANVNNKSFLSTNNKARSFHIFEEAFNYFVPIVSEIHESVMGEQTDVLSVTKSSPEKVTKTKKETEKVTKTKKETEKVTKTKKETEKVTKTKTKKD